MNNFDVNIYNLNFYIMTNFKEKIQDVYKSSWIIATITTIITLVVIFCLYKLGKIDYTEDIVLKILLLTIFIFGTTWFIADTVITWKNERENSDVKGFLENEKLSELEKNNPQYQQKKSDNAFKKPNKFANEQIDESIEFNNLPIKEEINNILKEPITNIPEYRYIAKNKITIPDNIDVYLDRGNL